MAKITKINCENHLICRICLIKAENSKVLNSKMFEYCTGINTTDISHSTQVCLQCETSLNEFCLFKEKCIESNKSLIEMYNENGDKSICEESLDSMPDNLNESNTLFLIEKLEETEENQNETSSELEPELFRDCDESLDSLDNFTEPNTLFLIDKMEKPEEENLNELQEEPSMDQTDSEDEINIEVTKTSKTKKKKYPKRKEFGLCTYCGNSYSLIHLKIHIKNVHSEPITDKSHKCDQCDKSYKRIEALSVHKRVVHKKLKPYVCKICNESFSYYKRYKSHLVHAHDAPYKFNCDICDYKTQECYKFTVHKRKHTGERPFQCKQCPKDFARASLLQCHMITHSKEKNFICEICSKAFGTSRYLSAHMKTHTKERNYVCPVESCGISFIQNRVMKKHILANHPEIEIPPLGTIVSKKSFLNK